MGFLTVEHVDKKRSSHDSIQDILPDPRPAREKRPPRNRTAGSLPRVLSRSPTYWPRRARGAFLHSHAGQASKRLSQVPRGKAAAGKLSRHPIQEGGEGNEGVRGGGESPRGPCRLSISLPFHRKAPSLREALRPVPGHTWTTRTLLTKWSLPLKSSGGAPRRSHAGQSGVNPQTRPYAQRAQVGWPARGGGRGEGGPPRDFTHPSRWYTHRMVSMIS